VSKPSSGPSPASARAGSSATQTRKKGAPKAPETPGVARIVAIANQKGGVGKSTTAVSLGAALADIGYRILVVDLDPQGNASTGMGIRHENREVTAYDVIVAESPVTDAIVHSPIERLDAIPSTIDLAGAEIELVSQFSREGRLKRALEPVREGVYDFIFLDCPPSLGLITINALTAAEELVVPIQCEYYALEGLGQLLRNVSLVQQNINQELRLTGIVMTMFDPRTKLSEQVVAEVRRFFGDLVYDSIIPRTVRLSEAPGFGLPITAYDPKSKGAESYRALAREVAERPPPDTPMPHFDDVPTLVVPTLGADPTPDEEELLEEEATGETAPPPVKAQAEALEEIPPQADVPVTPVAEAEAPQAEAVPMEVPATQQPSPAPQPPPEVPPQDQSAVDEDDLWETTERSDLGRVRPVTDVVPGELPQRRVVVIDDDAETAASGDRRAGEQQPGQPAPTIGGTLRDDDEGQRRRWRLFRKGGE
jgi:chromosome partitioning protein